MTYACPEGSPITEWEMRVRQSMLLDGWMWNVDERVLHHLDTYKTFTSAHWTESQYSNDGWMGRELDTQKKMPNRQEANTQLGEG